MQDREAAGASLTIAQPRTSRHLVSLKHLSALQYLRFVHLKIEVGISSRIQRIRQSPRDFHSLRVQANSVLFAHHRCRISHYFPANRISLRRSNPLQTPSNNGPETLRDHHPTPRSGVCWLPDPYPRKPTTLHSIPGARNVVPASVCSASE